jgi:hypothetical protein
MLKLFSRLPPDQEGLIGFRWLGKTKGGKIVHGKEKAYWVSWPDEIQVPSEENTDYYFAIKEMIDEGLL